MSNDFWYKGYTESLMKFHLPVLEIGIAELEMGFESTSKIYWMRQESKVA